MATWINVTPSLKRAANIINGLDTSKFPLLLSRISQSLQAGAINEKAFNNEEEEKLEVSLGLEKSDLKLLLESTTFILEQAAYYMTKPAVLQRYLSDTLELNEDKCEAFVNVWINSAKGIVEHLRQRSLFPAQLDEVRWSLSLQTASNAQTKQVIPKAVFQFGLKTNAGARDNATVAFTHEELYEFYKNIETIQTKLDGLH
ncbi:COMM domain-containing protein 10-like [Zootermopsis nevadensis]|uniref:COMM domain-containing protein 10 n=1 Tax=Zootermopsis nevadensis TaxID=136037 RepID=A0A067QU80_ZOONE|nr:COMM domain-containing protein 10-like [Zootermopsis nevadensis]KDR13576.1 COMM domain-containing protein 10 [Zootermopsis nevadensis]